MARKYPENTKALKDLPQTEFFGAKHSAPLSLLVKQEVR